MVEVYVSGELESAEDFPDQSLCVRYQLHLGGGWRLVEGAAEGQTQVDLSSVFEKAYFCHPLDWHLATKTIQGWPQIFLQVFHHDGYGRQELYGYGSAFLPNLPGMHEVKCNIWRPKGSLREELMQKYVGGGLQVSDPRVLVQPSARARIEGIGSGTVTLKLNLITRHYDRFGIVA